MSSAGDADSKLSRKRGCSVKTGLSVPPAPGGHARGRGSQLPQRGQTIASRSGAKTRPHSRGQSEALRETGEWLAHAAAHPRATPRKVALTTAKGHFRALSSNVDFSLKWRARPFFFGHLALSYEQSHPGINIRAIRTSQKLSLIHI